MLLGSINYNNNLGYILTFLLASLTVVSIFMTYRNMLYLRIGPAIVTPVFAGKPSTIAVQIDNQRYSTRFAVGYYLPKSQPLICDIAANAHATIPLPVQYAQRGYQPLPRFIIETTFPLGLFRAWSHVELQQSVLVYPQPGNDKVLPQLSVGNCEIIGSEIHFIVSIGNPRHAIMCCKPSNLSAVQTVKCGLPGRTRTSATSRSGSHN